MSAQTLTFRPPHRRPPSLIDYSASRFASSVDSERTVAPSTSLGRLESNFCRDFSCCGQDLGDLHDLLQHYEECHVRFDDDGVPGMIDDDGTSSGGTASVPSSMPPSPRAANANAQPRGAKLPDPKRQPNAAGLESPVIGKGKKRSFGQYDATNSGSSNNNNNAAVHQSLRRALIDGGVGSRSNRSSPSVYSANSPFSTPGNSIPGTPICEDSDFAFGNNGLSAFSALSLRPSSGEDHLPACAPPNLFFPAPGSNNDGGNTTTPGIPGLNIPNTSSTQQPPAKRERISSSGSTSNVGPGGEKLDKDGKVIEKPFKCPNPGCDKAYKQANGLKYHRLHGSCNRNLAVDGNSATPSPSQTHRSAAPAAAKPAPSTPGTPTPAPAAPRSLNVGASQPSVGQQTPQRLQNKVTPGVGPQQGTFPPRPTNIGNTQAPAGSVNNAGAPKTPFPLPPNINSAALAAAAALLQRGGPLPPNLQGPNGPIDSAALLKTLQMLQQQVAQQQQQNNGANTGANTAAANKGPSPTGAVPNARMQSPAGLNQQPQPVQGGISAQRNANNAGVPSANAGAAPAVGVTKPSGPGPASAMPAASASHVQPQSNAAAGSTTGPGQSTLGANGSPNANTNAGQQGKPNNLPSGITPEMLAAAQAAALQKRAQQAGAQR